VVLLLLCLLLRDDTTTTASKRVLGMGSICFQLDNGMNGFDPTLGIIRKPACTRDLAYLPIDSFILSLLCSLASVVNWGAVVGV